MIGHSLGRVGTCFGPSTPRTGAKTHLKSRCCAVLFYKFSAAQSVAKALDKHQCSAAQPVAKALDNHQCSAAQPVAKAFDAHHSFFARDTSSIYLTPY